MKEQDYINDIIENLQCIALGDFSNKIELSRKYDNLDAIATGINMLNEEIKSSLDKLQDSEINIKNMYAELKISEEKYRCLFETSPQGIIMMDLKGNVTSANSSFFKLSGYSKGEIIGKHFTRLPVLRKRDLPNYIKFFAKLIIQRNVDSIEYKWIHKNSEERWGSGHFGLIEKKGKAVGIQLIVGDITEQKKAEEEKNEAHKLLQKMNDELEAKVKERTIEIEKLLKNKDEFINQLGHDLKNPLNPLVNLLPIIESKETDSEKKKMLKIINRNVKYMKNLVTKTIELARLNSSNTVFNFEDTNLLSEINKVIETNKLMFEEKNIKIFNNLAGDIQIPADKLRLEELFNNLLNNSIKYTDGRGTITIDAKIDDNFVTVSFSDTGIGMTREQISHVFDEFYKADWSRHDFDSSGLGMTICKRIVERHSGHIWAVSKGPGTGSTFYFTLPRNFITIIEKPDIELVKDKKSYKNVNHQTISAKVDRLLERKNMV